VLSILDCRTLCNQSSNGVNTQNVKYTAKTEEVGYGMLLALSWLYRMDKVEPVQLVLSGLLTKHSAINVGIVFAFKMAKTTKN
jgi:hypothetical protein